MGETITRRRWLAASAATALAGCARRTAPVFITPASVSITRAPSYDQRLYATVAGIFEQHALDVRGRSVVIKPNLVEFEPDTSINTHPLVVHAIMDALLSRGAAAVRIAEGPGHRRNTLELAEAAGYFDIVPRFEDTFVDLNLDDVSRVRKPRRFSRLEKLYLPDTALAADLLISVAKMKTHHWVGATLSMKNLFGVVPGGVYGWPKNPLHWAGINECVADLDAIFPRKFAIVDGIVGMEGNGPIHGSPKPLGVLVAGRNPAAVDATCCRIMGIDPFRIEYLRLAAGEQMALIAETNIRQIGEPIAGLAAQFKLPDGFETIRMEDN